VDLSYSSGTGRSSGATSFGTGDAERDTEILRALLARCASADAAALDEVYRRVAPLLLGCLMRILRQRDRAEDALQDVFVQIWQRAGQFDPQRGHPLAWMVSMARYRAIDIARASRPTHSLDARDDQGGLEFGFSHSVDPTDEYAAGHATQALDRCFDRLSDPQQRCIRLAFFSGLSHEEVAGVVRSPLGTVKSWIRRALQNLRECMSS